MISAGFCGGGVTIESEKYVRTKEYTPNACLACALVRQPTLVRLETRKSDSHLGNDPAENCTEAFV